MVQLSWILVAAAAVVSGVTAQGSGYAQCGGNNWAGATTCISGWHCEKLNDYYSQCLPGGATSTSSSVPTSTSTTSGGSPTTSSTSSAGPAPTAPSTGPGSTLQPNYLWIRAVAAPNFHKYLQSATARTATDAVLEAPTSAGQFNVVSGQLVQLIDTAGTKLYGHVQERPDSATVKLQLTWKTTPDTYGTFGFSGDTLTWTHASISRPNTAAFLVCENQRVYINLGPYMYQTPAGCSDQTIHYYNGATADA